MGASIEGVRDVRVNRALLPVPALFAGGLTLSALYARTGVGVPCPFRMLTGWDCPLCGGTRMGSAALQGRMAEAFSWNPVLFLALCVLAVLAALWTVEAVAGPVLRRPRRLAARLRWISAGWWLLVGLVIAVAYTVARNLG